MSAWIRLVCGEMLELQEWRQKLVEKDRENIRDGDEWVRSVKFQSSFCDVLRQNKCHHLFWGGQLASNAVAANDCEIHVIAPSIESPAQQHSLSPASV